MRRVKRARYKRSPKREFRVRLPKDYPWKVLQATFNCVAPRLGKFDHAVMSRILRSRSWSSYDHLSTSWSLQSMSSGCSVDPADIDRWTARLLLGGLVRKYTDQGSSSESRESAAINIFLDADRNCSRLNQRIGRTTLLDESFVNHARDFINRTLGYELPDPEKLTRTARHGPGASSSTSSGRTHAFYKYTSFPYHCTASAIPYAQELIRSDARWYGALEAAYREKNQIPPWAILDRDQFWSNVIMVQDGNRITTVPKDRFKDRSIAIEPTLNMLLQLGVDGFIRKRLKRWGIDIDSQDKNNHLSRAGSIRCDDMSPVTIDLAAASDSISLRLCKILLPACWYRYLTDIRSPRGLLPSGKVHRYSKISSMGNGYTFALETLIFAAYVYAACKLTLGYFPRQTVAVYGDDIIVPQCVSKLLIRHLNISGFGCNVDKTFIEGPVRESCGTDWYRGQDVRGVFLKDRPRYVDELLRDRNRIYCWLVSHGIYDSAPLDSLFKKWIPTELQQIVGPPTREDFTSYWHSLIAPQPTDLSGQIEIRRIVVSSQTEPARGDFLLGRLCCRLIPGEPKPIWVKAQSSEGTVSDLPSNRVRRSITKGVCYDWHISYLSRLE